MRGHVDAESLALYAEGQLSRGRTARVRAHLSSCPECAATVAALAEVTAQLSHVPVPPMPAAVAARLDAALSTEAAARAAAPGTAPAGAPRPPRRNPLRSPGALRILAATGAALVVAGGVGYAVSQSGSSGTSSGTSGAAAPAAGRQHRPAMQAAPNVSPGSRLRKPHTSPNRPTPTGTRYVRTGTDYRPGTFVAQARKTLALYDVPGISGPAMLPASSVPASVATCIHQVAHGRPVRLADLAHYQQHPATVIVLGNTVTAISSSCTPLHSARLP